MNKKILINIFQKSINAYAKNKNITLYNLNTVYDCMMSIIECGYLEKIKKEVLKYENH